MGEGKSHNGFHSRGHVMLETMFQRIKLERKTAPKKFLAANGEQIKDLGGTKIPFKTNEVIQKRITKQNLMESMEQSNTQECAHEQFARQVVDVPVSQVVD